MINVFSPAAAFALHCTPPLPAPNVLCSFILSDRKANTNSNRKAFFIRMGARRTEFQAITFLIFICSGLLLSNFDFFCPFTVSARKVIIMACVNTEIANTHFVYHTNDLLAINYRLLRRSLQIE